MTITRPASGSANHQPSVALRSSPASTVVASRPSTRVTRASVRSTGLSSARPVRALPAARLNMASAVAAVQTMPRGLCAAWWRTASTTADLDDQVGGECKEGDTDHPQRAALPIGVRARELPHHNRAGADLDQAVEAEACERHAARRDRRDAQHTDSDDVPSERGVFKPQASAKQHRSIRAHSDSVAAPLSSRRGSVRRAALHVVTSPGSSARASDRMRECAHERFRDGRAAEERSRIRGTQPRASCGRGPASRGLAGRSSGAI